MALPFATGGNFPPRVESAFVSTQGEMDDAIALATEQTAQERDVLRRSIEAVLELHYDCDTTCRADGDDWPCATYRAIAQAL